MCVSPKFPYSKHQGYYEICREFSQYFSEELNMSAKSVLHMKHAQITDIGTGKNWSSDREKNWNFEKKVWVGTLLNHIF